MGDRFRLPELLAAIGTIGLAISMIFGRWMDASSRTEPAQYGRTIFGEAGFSAHGLGWFAFAILVLTVVAGAVFLARTATARGPERFMLQAPIAYVVAGFAFLVLLVRLLIFQPGASTVVTGDDFPGAGKVMWFIESSPTTVGYLGLLFTWLICVGAWFSMRDERTGTKDAKARTARLLAGVPTRPAPPLGAAPTPDPDAVVVADDAVGTDPTVPAAPGPGAVHADPPPPSDPTSGSPA